MPNKQKPTFYFNHDYNARNDIKISLLREDYGMEGVGIYWCIIEMLYEEDGYLPLTEIENISKILRTNTTVVRAIINSNLFKNDENNFWSESVLRRLEIRKEKSEKARQSVSKRYERTTNVNDRIRPYTNKSNTNQNKSNTNQNKTYTKENILKEKNNEEDDLDNHFKKFVEIYEDKFKKIINNTDAELLQELSDEFPVKWFEEAIDKALENGANNLKYASKILYGRVDNNKNNGNNGNGYKPQEKPQPPIKDVGEDYLKYLERQEQRGNKNV